MSGEIAAVGSGVSAIEEPTAQLRFIERDVGNARTLRILQQAWAIKTYQGSTLAGFHSEWRDIPLVTENGAG